jgi:S1-C subfamily serine protease
MKKLFLSILVLGLLLGGNAFAELINFEKCFQKNEIFKDNTFKDTSYFQDENTWSVNTSTNKITHIIKYNKKYDFKDLYWDFDLYNFTDNLILARTFAYNTPDHEWLEDRNDNSVISYEIVIDIKKKQISIKRFPNEFRGLNINRISSIAKAIKLTFNETFEKYVGFYHDVYLCEKVVGLGDKHDEKGGTSSGTAFFINKKGYLLTNNHVVEGCTLSKISYKNKDYDTKLIATDKTLDLALLKAEIKPKTFLNFSNDEAKKLNKVYVAGYPLGKGLSDDLKISSGIVSSIKGFEDNSNEIQIDAPINPGNSGGPIINENGDLIAIAVSGMAKDQTEGINFGIKSSAAARFLTSNNINPKKSMYSGIKDNDQLLEILEGGTVYTYCD